MKRYKRPNGEGTSKTLVFADLIVGVVTPVLGLLIEEGEINGRWGYIALGVAGIVTRYLRQTSGPTA